MKSILKQRFEKQSLTQQQAYDALSLIGKGHCNPTQITAFITTYIMQKITVDELKGFQQAMLDLCIPADFSSFNTIDVCGTGGDGKNSFNISTLAGIVLAGAGYQVAKHGNYGVSSICGSSHVLEFLGYQFTNNTSVLQKQLETANFCMLHAPLFHPAMKQVAPIRKDLGVKTFFNMLGPLVNPSLPKNQIIGVFSQELARIYHYLLQNTSSNYNILYSLDGYDEVSLTGTTKLFSTYGESIFTPEQIDLNPIHPHHLKGGTSIKESAKIFVDVLKNESSQEKKQVVLANATLAIKTLEPQLNLDSCFHKAKTSLESGKAYQSLLKILN